MSEGRSIYARFETRSRNGGFVRLMANRTSPCARTRVAKVAMEGPSPKGEKRAGGRWRRRKTRVLPRA